MAQSFTYEFERRNGPDEDVTEITVEYAVTSWGCDAQTYGPAENCYPAEPIEIDILSVDTPFGPFVLRDDEVEQVEQHACEMGAEPDYGPDDWER